MKSSTDLGCWDEAGGPGDFWNLAACLNLDVEYTLPTKPRSAPGETGRLWCATLCGNISVG